MIKISLKATDLTSLATKYYNTINNRFDITTKLANRSIDIASLLFKLIENDIADIITGTPDKLELIISKLSTPYNHIIKLYSKNNGVTISKAKKWLKDEVFKIFDYDNFTKCDNKQLAYNHALSLEFKVCPYCNTQYIFTINKNNKKSRPPFDHFFDKATYPYLSLSFYNLIPACTFCNSNYKNVKSFKHSTHIHPFIDDFQGLYSFKTNIKSADFLKGKGFDLKLEKLKFADKTLQKKAGRNIKDFNIEDRYFYHKEYVGDLIKNSHVYNNSKIEELYNFFNNGKSSIFSTKEELRRLIFGTDLHKDNLNTRILSKLTKDIANEFGII